MAFGGLFCDQLFEALSAAVQVVACDLCALDPPPTPVVTACGHCFCWPCMSGFLQGQAKPCPVCSTMLSSNTNVTPTFDADGLMVLHLPTAEEVQPRRDDDSDDDDMLDWCDTAAFAAAAPRSEEVPRTYTTRGLEMELLLCRLD